MQIRERIEPRFLFVSLAGLVLSGCASHTAPSGWLPGVNEAATGTRGAWVTVTRQKPLEPKRIHGELLGVGDSALVVLPHLDRRHGPDEPFSEWEFKSSRTPGSPIAIHYREIQEVKATFYDAPEGGMAAWTAIGTLGTISHGWALIFSAPTWIIVGSVSTGDVSREPEAKGKTVGTIMDLRKFARFPQGMPAGVPITAVRDER